MSRKIGVSTVAALLLLGAVTLPGAKDTGFDLGLSLNYGLFEEYDSGYGAFAHVNYQLGKSFLLQLQGGIEMVSTLNDPQGLGPGKLSLMPVQLSLFYRLPLSRKMILRLGGGAGYAFSSFQFDEEDKWSQVGFTATQKLDPGPLYHAALAVDFQVSEKMTLFVEGRYCAGQLDGEYEMIDRIGGETFKGSWREEIRYAAITAGLSVSLRKTPSVQRFVVPERRKNQGGTK